MKTIKKHEKLVEEVHLSWFQTFLNDYWPTYGYGVGDPEGRFSGRR